MRARNAENGQEIELSKLDRALLTLTIVDMLLGKVSQDKLHAYIQDKLKELEKEAA